MKDTNQAPPLSGQVSLDILQITNLITVMTGPMAINDNWMTTLSILLGTGGKEKEQHRQPVQFVGRSTAHPAHHYVRSKHLYMRAQARHVLYISVPLTSWSHHLLTYVLSTMDWEYETAEDLRDGAMTVLRSWLLVQEGDRTITAPLITDIEGAIAIIAGTINKVITQKDKYFYACHYNNRLAQLVIEYTDEPTHDAVP